MRRKRQPKRNPPPRRPRPQARADDTTPISSIPCLNNVEDMERFEESEDCFILGFDPSSSNNTAPTPRSMDDSAAQNPNDDDDDICVLSEKGQVACRDFPHSRHECVKYPFQSTPHQSHCEMCFCYVCDSPAPCKFWSSECHYDAENVASWNFLRKMYTSGKHIHM